jgi:tetratricopeptide (TPR) repeat protein
MAYREALKEWTRDRVPLDWARIQHNLGNVLSTLGERRGQSRFLSKAEAAYYEALKELTWQRVPLDWAIIQNNLGNARAALGERTRDVTKLKEARDVIAAAFDVFMQAGQGHRRAYFEKRLSEIDRKIAELTQRPGA